MFPVTGHAIRLAADDIEDAASRLGCEVAALRAVMAVESRNSGYDGKGRPIILFEPHVFYRNLKGPARARAVSAGLAYPKWGTRPYAKGQDDQYARLARAAEIDAEAAYRSISVGMGQILGENCRAAGCSSAVDMFQEACESEAAQLAHMVSFIKSRGLQRALKAKDWKAFARAYNGPGQVPKYSAWLAREYAKWAKRKPARPPRNIEEPLEEVEEVADDGEFDIPAHRHATPSEPYRAPSSSYDDFAEEAPKGIIPGLKAKIAAAAAAVMGALEQSSFVNLPFFTGDYVGVILVALALAVFVYFVVVPMIREERASDE